MSQKSSPTAVVIGALWVKSRVTYGNHAIWDIIVRSNDPQ